MSIRVQMFIKLPYVIRLDEDKDYSFTFPNFKDFSEFELVFRFNDEDNEDYYNKDYPTNTCWNLGVEAVYKNIDHLDYLKYTKNNRIDLPEEEMDEVFQAVGRQLNNILSFLRVKSKMFWVENLPVQLVAYSSNSEIEFCFYTPETKTRKQIRFTTKYTDYYMIEKNHGNIKDINNSFFDDFRYKNYNSDKSILYLNKAEKSLFE